MTDLQHQATAYSPRVKLINSVEEFTDLSLFWHSSQWHPCHDYDDVVSAFENPHPNGHPHVFAVMDQGLPISALIGWVKPVVPPWKLGYKSVTERHRPCLEFPYGALLGVDPSPSASSALVSQVLDFVSNGHADYALFHYLNVHSNLYEQAKSMPSFRSRDPFSDPVPHYTLSLPATYEQYVSSRSKNTRSDIRRHRNKLRKTFGDGARVATFSDVADIDATACAVSEIEAVTWQYHSLDQKVTTPREIKGWRDDAKRNRFLAQVLFIDDKPIAFNLGMTYEGRYDGFYTGYNPEYRKFSPGSYLLAETIENLCADPNVRLMDLGFSAEQYKKHYCDYSTERDSVTLFAPNLQGGKIFLLRLLAGGSNIAAKRVLNRLGIFEDIRQYLRRRKSN